MSIPAPTPIDCGTGSDAGILIGGLTNLGLNREYPERPTATFNASEGGMGCNVDVLTGRILPGTAGREGGGGDQRGGNLLQLL